MRKLSILPLLMVILGLLGCDTAGPQLDSKPAKKPSASAATQSQAPAGRKSGPRVTLREHEISSQATDGRLKFYQLSAGNSFYRVEYNGRFRNIGVFAGPREIDGSATVKWSGRSPILPRPGGNVVTLTLFRVGGVEATPRTAEEVEKRLQSGDSVLGEGRFEVIFRNAYKVGGGDAIGTYR